MKKPLIALSSAMLASVIVSSPASADVNGTLSAPETSVSPALNLSVTFTCRTDGLADVRSTATGEVLGYLAGSSNTNKMGLNIEIPPSPAAERYYYYGEFDYTTGTSQPANLSSPFPYYTGTSVTHITPTIDTTAAVAMTLTSFPVIVFNSETSTWVCTETTAPTDIRGQDVKQAIKDGYRGTELAELIRGPKKK